MKRIRNVITLSNMDPALEEWAKNEAKQRGIHFYEVINDALRIAQVVSPRLQGVERPPREEGPQQVPSR